jgi:hypothetical protein
MKICTIFKSPMSLISPNLLLPGICNARAIHVVTKRLCTVGGSIWGEVYQLVLRWGQLVCEVWGADCSYMCEIRDWNSGIFDTIHFWFRIPSLHYVWAWQTCLHVLCEHGWAVTIHPSLKQQQFIHYQSSLVWGSPTIKAVLYEIHPPSKQSCMRFTHHQSSLVWSSLPCYQ